MNSARRVSFTWHDQPIRCGYEISVKDKNISRILVRSVQIILFFKNVNANIGRNFPAHLYISVGTNFFNHTKNSTPPQINNLSFNVSLNAKPNSGEMHDLSQYYTQVDSFNFCFCKSHIDLAIVYNIFFFLNLFVYMFYIKKNFSWCYTI